MAEGLMKKKIKDAGYEHLFHVESRATSTYEIGQPPHPKTQAILKRENAMLDKKTAQQISSHDFEIFDYIIAMDQSNVINLKRMRSSQQHKIYLLRDIDPKTKNEDVPDPYYSGRYEETFKLIDESLDVWLNHLKNNVDSY
jgi:protein-tyrosine phosphatase